MQGSSGTTDEISMKQMPSSQKQYVQSWCDKHMNEPNVTEGEGSKSTQCSNQVNLSLNRSAFHFKICLKQVAILCEICDNPKVLI